MSLKTKKAKIDNENNIDFSNSKIEFNSMNISTDAIDIYLLHNSKKILSKNKNQNYYRIIAKNIGVKDSFEDIVCKIVNDIEVKISIKIKNKFSSTGMSMKDRLKIFSQKSETQKKPVQNQYVPKKLSIPNFMNNIPMMQNQPKKPKPNEPKKEAEIIKKEEQKQEIKKEITPTPVPTPKENKVEQPKKKEANNDKEKINNNNSNNNNNKNIKKDEQKKEGPKKIEKLKPLEDNFKEKISKLHEKKEGNLPQNLGGFEKINVNLVKSMTVKEKPSEVKNLEDDFVVLKLDDNKAKEIFLKSKKYTDYLDEQYQKNIKHPYRETFCEGFFIASFPKKHASVIELNTSFMAQCQHRECSKLPGMKPEIIFRYPLKDTKTLELNNLAATICFPTGIKVCYEENSQPKQIQDYVTSITNQKGERYYMMTYHFYIKMDTEYYNKQYEENPLKYNLRKFGEAYIGLSEDELTEKMINDIQKNLEWNQELANREIVFVPFCICLISKYPYVKPMSSCLKSIYTILNNESSQNGDFIINDIIMYLINSIPIPTKNTSVKFLIPFNKTSIELDCPKLDDINVMNLSACKLLCLFTIDNLIIIFRLLLSEKKILLIDTDYEKLSAVADGLVALLYPLQWVHTYIPIMSDQMLKYLETFLPFLNGINESLMSSVEKVFKEGEMEEDDEVFLIYIRENKIKLSSTLRGKNKKFEKYVQDNVLSLPSSLEKELKNKLKKAKYRLDEVISSKKENTRQNRLNSELQARDAFIDVFVEMFQGYAKYLSFIDQDAVFNKTLFLQNKANNEKKFYSDLIDTQLFQQFAQNVINSDVGYFNKKIALKESRKKNNKKKEQIPETKKEYFICPDFLKIGTNSSSNFDSLLTDMQKKFPENDKTNTVLIMEKILDIKDEDYNEKNCDIFFTEEELENENKNQRREPNILMLEMMKEANLKNNSIQKDENEEMSEKDKDAIKESIKDVVVKIFSSEEITLDQKNRNDLLNKLNLPVGREFFVSLLSKNDINIILLNANSFTLLWTLIYNSLLNMLKLEETDKILEEFALLIKSTKYFGCQAGDKIKTLFDKNISKFQSLPKISQGNFWQKWYDIEIKKNEKEKDDVKFKQNLIYDICKILIRLELPKSMIKNFADSININEFGKGSDLQVETFKVIIKFITSANYISKAV